MTEIFESFDRQAALKENSSSISIQELFQTNSSIAGRERGTIGGAVHNDGIINFRQPDLPVIWSAPDHGSRAADFLSDAGEGLGKDLDILTYSKDARQAGAEYMSQHPERYQHAVLPQDEEVRDFQDAFLQNLQKGGSIFDPQFWQDFSQMFSDLRQHHQGCGGQSDEYADTAGKKKIWGDPHLVADDGTQVDDQIEAGKDVMLLKSKDGNSIVGETAKFDLANQDSTATVFDQECVTLSGGTKVIFKGDGTAYHYDASKPDHLGCALRDGETVTGEDSNDKVTYNASQKTLAYSFKVGSDHICGTLQGNKTADENHTSYVNTTIDDATGKYGGMMPAMKTSFNNVLTDTTTGAGAFTKDANGNERTNEDFYVNSLYEGCHPRPEEPPYVPPEEPPYVPPEEPPYVPPEEPPYVPPEQPPNVPPEEPPHVPPEQPPHVPPEIPPEKPPTTPPVDASDLNSLIKVGRNVSQADLKSVEDALKNTSEPVKKALRDMKPEILLVTDADDPHHVAGAAAYWEPENNLVVIHAGSGMVAEAADHEFWHVADTRFGITDDPGFQQAIHQDLQNGALSKLGRAAQILVDPPYVDGTPIGDIFAELGPDLDGIDDTGIAGLMGSSFKNAEAWLDNWRKTH